MRTIIFGGSGFIGSHLAQELLDAGDEVTIADLVEPRHLRDHVRFERCDVRETIKLRSRVPFDHVYNLAAIHRTPGHEPYEYYDTNVTGAVNVTEWCESGGGEHLTFTSSIAPYGPGEDPKCEDSTPVPCSDYGRSKLMAEAVHRSWQRSRDGRVLRIVRPAVVFGPGEQGNFTRLAQALARKRFAYAGRSDTIKGCGYVTDLVRALRWSESLGDDAMTFNYCYPTPYTIADICEAFHQVAGYRLPRTLPPQSMSAALFLLSTVNPKDHGVINAARVRKLTASTHVVPQVLMTRGFEWQTDIVSALQAWQKDTDGQFV